MDRNRVVVAATAITIFFAIACTTASNWTSHSPLYTFRMEQASNRMNFFPAERNDFVYTTGEGYELNCDVTLISGESPQIESVVICTFNCPTEAATCADPTECFINTCKETQCDRTCYACG